jgi:hypothetical protein
MKSGPAKSLIQIKNGGMTGRQRRNETLAPPGRLNGVPCADVAARIVFFALMNHNEPQRSRS